jgi:hypothetical protein
MYHRYCILPLMSGCKCHQRGDHHRGDYPGGTCRPGQPYRRYSNLLNLVLGIFALLFGTLNVIGGFVVTDRMLEMFKKKKK